MNVLVIDPGKKLGYVIKGPSTEILKALIHQDPDELGKVKGLINKVNLKAYTNGMTFNDEIHAMYFVDFDDIVELEW